MASFVQSSPQNTWVKALRGPVPTHKEASHSTLAVRLPGRPAAESARSSRSSAMWAAMKRRTSSRVAEASGRAGHASRTSLSTAVSGGGAGNRGGLVQLDRQCPERPLDEADDAGAGAPTHGTQPGGPPEGDASLHQAPPGPPR